MEGWVHVAMLTCWQFELEWNSSMGWVWQYKEVCWWVMLHIRNTKDIAEYLIMRTRSMAVIDCLKKYTVLCNKMLLHRTKRIFIGHDVFKVNKSNIGNCKSIWILLGSLLDCLACKQPCAFYLGECFHEGGWGEAWAFFLASRLTNIENISTHQSTLFAW